MNPDKAKRRLEHYLKLRKPEPIDNFNAAVQLGKEALERLEVYRNRHPELIWELLPGETED